MILLAPKISLQLCLFDWNTSVIFFNNLYDTFLQKCLFLSLFVRCFQTELQTLDIHTECRNSYKKNVSMYVHVNSLSVLLWDGQRNYSEWPTASLGASLVGPVCVDSCVDELSRGIPHQHRSAAALVVSGKFKGCSMFQASFSNGISSE